MSGAVEKLAFRDREVSSEVFENAYLRLQRITFRFKEACGRLTSPREYEEGISQLLGDLMEFRERADRPLLWDVVVRVPRLPQKARLGFIHPRLTSPRTLVLPELINALEASLSAASREKPYRTDEGPDDEKPVADLDSVRRAIPMQRVAPAQFEISGGILKLRAQPRQPKKDSAGVAGQSLEALLSQGADIQKSLESGNFDRRLAEKVRELNDSLKSKENIIKLGLQNITCSSMAIALAEELSGTVSAQIEGFCAGLAMYVAQFEEWQTFVQNAAEAVISEGNSNELKNFADSLLREIATHSSAVDPEVPRTIEFLAGLIEDPKRTSKPAIFAFIRTIENLVIETFGYVLAIVSETAEQTKKKVAAKGSTYIVRALVGIGLISATGLLPVAAQVKGMEWIQAAYQVVKEQIAPKIDGF
jgi:hypothetical protein